VLQHNPHLIYMSLRPSGLHEYVDRTTGVVSFSPQARVFSAQEQLQDMDILVNPQDVAFASRPQGWLHQLREERVALLAAARSSKKRSTHKESPNGSSSSGPKRSSKASLALAAQVSALSSTNLGIKGEALQKPRTKL